jgi:hypothetical protein
LVSGHQLALFDTTADDFLARVPSDVSIVRPCLSQRPIGKWKRQIDALSAEDFKPTGVVAVKLKARLSQQIAASWLWEMSFKTVNHRVHSAFER